MSVDLFDIPTEITLRILEYLTPDLGVESSESLSDLSSFSLTCKDARSLCWPLLWQQLRLEDHENEARLRSRLEFLEAQGGRIYPHVRSLVVDVKDRWLEYRERVVETPPVVPESEPEVQGQEEPEAEVEAAADPNVELWFGGGGLEDDVDQEEGRRGGEKDGPLMEPYWVEKPEEVTGLIVRLIPNLLNLEILQGSYRSEEIYSPIATSNVLQSITFGIHVRLLSDLYTDHGDEYDASEIKGSIEHLKAQNLSYGRSLRRLHFANMYPEVFDIVRNGTGGSIDWLCMRDPSASYDKETLHPEVWSTLRFLGIDCGGGHSDFNAVFQGFSEYKQIYPNPPLRGVAFESRGSQSTAEVVQLMDHLRGQPLTRLSLMVLPSATPAFVRNISRLFPNLKEIALMRGSVHKSNWDEGSVDEYISALTTFSRLETFAWNHWATNASEEEATVTKMAASIPTLKKVAYFDTFGSHDYVSSQPWLIERSQGQGSEIEVSVKQVEINDSLVDDRKYYFFPRLSSPTSDFW